MTRSRAARLASLLIALALPSYAIAETRVATLVPSVEEALAGIEGVTIVAGVRSSFRAPERTDVLDLGSPHSPNVERLAESRADLVIGDALINGHLTQSLARFGAEVMLIDTTTVDGTLRDLATLGEKLGGGEAFAARVTQAREDLATQRLETPIEVLTLFGTPGRFQVVTKQAWLGSLLDELGFVNLGADATGAFRVPGFVELSHEQLAVMRPQMVLMVAHGDPRAIEVELQRKLSGSGPWGKLGASANLGVHVLSPTQFVANPGLGLPRAAEALVALANEASDPAPAVSAAP